MSVELKECENVEMLMKVFEFFQIYRVKQHANILLGIFRKYCHKGTYIIQTFVRKLGD